MNAKASVDTFVAWSPVLLLGALLLPESQAKQPNR